MNDESVRGSHPGWAVQFQDGRWLGSAHGLHRFDDAFYAKSFLIKEDANDLAIECQIDFGDTMPYEVVPAWEPLCERLRFEVGQLMKACKFKPRDISDLQESLEDALRTVKKFS
jgi:hypothetical protein